MKRTVIAATVAAALTLAACSPKSDTSQQSQAAAPAPAAAALAPDVPAGAYTLDRPHASLLFKVNHMGFSSFTARFKRFDAQLQFDPAHLETAQLTATVDVSSIETDYPDPAKVDFNGQLQGAEFLNATQFPQMTYRSTKVEQTGPDSVRVSGDLTLHGVTHPVALDVKFNGGYPGMALDPHARIGFSAHGTLKRSEFGIGFGIPQPGSHLGVSDEVTIVIESEFTGPPTPGVQAAPGSP